jgi:hypothetical protein
VKEVEVMETMVQDHERRIAELEKQAVETKNQYLRLENTVMIGSKNTENLLNKVLEKVLDLKGAETQQEHELKAAERQQQYELAKTKTVSRKEVWLAIFGTGGVAIAVVTGIFAYLQ